MKARILIIATLATSFTGILPAVDSHLLGLVMPDAKILAGANVVSVMHSPFGQYVLTQMSPNESELQKFAVLTGFDPRNDLIEVLAASNAMPGSKTGLALATGTFNTSAITAAATTHGATTENYNGATLVVDPKEKTSAIAFLGSTIALAGDIDSVKAAIDRQSAPSKIDSNLASQAATLSANQDAWVVSIAPFPAPPKTQTATPQQPIPGLPVPVNALQQIVGGNAGVKFGTNIVITAQATADNAQDATNLAGMLQLLANMAKLQADKNPQVASLANGLVVNSSGTSVNITFTVPEDQFQKLISQQSQHKPAAAHTPHKKQ